MTTAEENLYAEIAADLNAADESIRTAGAKVSQAKHLSSGKDTVIESKSQEIVKLKEQIEALENQIPPPTTPPDNPPANIYDFRFDDGQGIDWNLCYSDGDPEAPAHRFIAKPDYLEIEWVCNNPVGGIRTEFGVRATPGGGETPIRAPVKSTRHYLYEFFIPEGYVLNDAEADHKRVIWQCHQSGGSIPPLSLEIRNGDFHLIPIDNTKKIFDIPVVKGVWHTLKVKAFWDHTSAGRLDVLFDEQAFSYIGRNCYDAISGMNNKGGSYQPGAKTGEYPTNYTIRHYIKRFACGSEAFV